MRVKEAVENVKEYIQSIIPKNWGDEVDILHWKPGKWGFRVAEISFNHSNGSGGSSIMQSDHLNGARVLWSVERYVLHLMYGREIDNPMMYNQLLDTYKEMIRDSILEGENKEEEEESEELNKWY